MQLTGTVLSVVKNMGKFNPKDRNMFGAGNQQFGVALVAGIDSGNHHSWLQDTAGFHWNWDHKGVIP